MDKNLIKVANRNFNSNHNNVGGRAASSPTDMNGAARIFTNSVDNGAIDDVTELTHLRPRGGGSNQSYMSERAPPDDVVFLEREILPTDTLQSFALLYGCTLNDIKRANNLIREQDFYALRHLKIPVKRHGLLTEIEEETKRRPVTTSIRGSQSDDVYTNENQEIESSESSENISLLTSSTNHNPATTRNEANKFLKKLDKEIRKTVRSSDALGERNEVLEEVVSSLGSIGYRPLPPPGGKDDCNGADWGVKWWVLLLGFLAIFFLFMILGGYEYYHMTNIEIPTTPSGR
uniref:lysM and putative peptidoglycan-binding domain-containing protein 3 n=1 Tax=Ciona intestinalis TaxID=7719 RepID=UPI0000524294|nr:lysM and putative peptidoglycan-binding domain-containing protein 3 [Ciona intestinalis]|eukprot:XP_002125253.1 lysM and putative peptidoglycan-binding domain-containing protein 3 [Ciona intestinalis]